MGFLDEEEDTEEESEQEVIDAEFEEVESEQEETLPDSTPQADNSLLEPVANAEEVAAVYDKFEDIKEQILKSNDTTEISGNIHVNKSGWRKIATAFNVSVEIVDDVKIIEDGVVKFKVKARATAPNGKTSTGVAICASNESNHMESLSEKKADKDDPDVLKVDGAWRRLRDPREVNEHNIYATAATRSKNRAISDLVGGGEVSAEEIKAEDVL